MESPNSPPQKPGLLIVDDEAHNLDSLQRLFRNKYQIFRAQSGEDAVQTLEAQAEQIQVAISDQKMPGLSGVEFFEKSLLIKPDLIRILLTGYTDLDALIDAINEAQVFRYLNKPWDPIDLERTVDQAFEQYRLTQEVHAKTKDLEKAYSQLKQLDRAKSQFMILINHELKTPLTSVLSYSQMLQEEKLSPDQLKWVARIKQSGEKLKELVDDSLTLISAETKILPLQIQKFEIRQLGLSNRLKLALESPLSKDQEFEKWRCIGDLTRVQLAIQKIDQHILHFGAQPIETQQTTPQPIPSDISVLIEGNRRVRFEFCYSHKLDSNKNQPLPYQEPHRWLSPFYSGENLLHHASFQGLALPVAHAVLKLFQSGLQITAGTLPGQVKIAFDLNRLT